MIQAYGHPKFYTIRIFRRGERESKEGRVFVYIEDYNYLVSGSQGLARWIQGSLEIQLLYSIQFFSILIKF